MKETEEKIRKLIDQIRPYLNSDGGDIEFIKYENQVVYIKLLGGCACCPHRNETISHGILETLKNEIPEIKEVINVEI